MNKYLFLLAMLAGCATGWAASTETCPSVENGYWMDYSTEEILISNADYKWEKTGRGCFQNNNIFAPFIAILWRKVPYKIEWWSLLNYEPTGDQVWLISKAVPLINKKYPVRKIMEIGLREDGVVIWRKKETQ